ncbi:MAG: taurine dioxygenase [Rhodospirillaceae bacterium]|nr:taurine dioxygenase [Rhodospirillaceae bacterium]
MGQKGPRFAVSISVTPIAGALGAEIGDVNVADDLDDDTIADIRRALLDHQVIFFRDQTLDVERHKSFTRAFGELFVHPNFQFGQENPEIVYVRREPGDEKILGQGWHADTTMMAKPPMGAILYAMEVPPTGGDTLFANQYLAYEALSAGMKRLLEPLHAVHNDTRVAGPNLDLNDKRASQVRDDENWRPTENLHPVVRIHPETGQKHLFVNPIYVHRFDGMTEAESQPLLNYLYDHAVRPEFTCRFSWRRGSIAFWDNRCPLHLAVHDSHDHVRHMQRTQIA